MRFFVFKHDTGGTYYRQTLPLRHCAAELARRGIRITHSADYDEAKGYKVAFLQRHVRIEYLPALIAMKRYGVVLVWDWDDDVAHIETFPEAIRAKIIVRTQVDQLCLDMADLVTVTNEQLRQRLGRPEKTMVCPNLVDLVDHPPEPYDGGREAILYTGSHSHDEDLELVREIHRQTYRGLPWVFYGIKPKWITKRDTFVPWSRLADYPKLLRMIRPRVTLCPLQPTLFNQGKSPIKAWECGVLGGSVLASDTGPYRGHPAALVAEGQPFTVEDLAAVWARPNHHECLGEAERNSWQFSRDGRNAWLAMFTRVQSLADH